MRFVLPEVRFGLRLPWYICASSHAHNTLSLIRYEGSEPIDAEDAAPHLNVLRVLWSRSGSMGDYQEVYNSKNEPFLRGLMLMILPIFITQPTSPCPERSP